MVSRSPVKCTMFHFRALVFHPSIPVNPGDKVYWRATKKPVATISQYGTFLYGTEEHIVPLTVATLVFNDKICPCENRSQIKQDGWSKLGLNIPDYGIMSLKDTLITYQHLFPSEARRSPAAIYKWMTEAIGIPAEYFGPPPSVFSPNVSDYDKEFI